MQAHKLKGKIDHSGKLIITEPINLDPGDVEVIILQSAMTENKPANNELLETQNQLFWQGESIESLILKTLQLNEYSSSRYRCSIISSQRGQSISKVCAYIARKSISIVIYDCC
jgi:hypothetical protein